VPYVKAAYCAIQTYIHLHDKPATSEQVQKAVMGSACPHILHITAVSTLCMPSALA